MPELRPGLWSINANGFEGQLRLAIDGAGNIVEGCTVFGDPIAGFFNRGQGAIIFVRQSPPGGQADVQVYTGNLGGPTTLSGQFTAFQSTGGSPEQWLFNWQAEHRGQILDE